MIGSHSVIVAKRVWLWAKVAAECRGVLAAFLRGSRPPINGEGQDVRVEHCRTTPTLSDGTLEVDPTCGHVHGSLTCFGPIVK